MPPSPIPAVPLAIVVMGVSGCGKTTLGRLLAEALDCPFLDGDDFHAPEAVAKMRGGRPLEDADRWPWLERLGAATAETASTHGSAVTACSALRRCYRDRLRLAIGPALRFVLLDPPRARLLQRLSERGGHFMPAILLDSQLDTLERPMGEDDAISFAGQEPPEALRDRALAQLAGISPRSGGKIQSC